MPRKPPAKPRPLDPGDRAVAFINKLTHTGDFAGKPFELRPWQADIVRRLFGTVRPDGLRQYRKAFLALPRKQGKALALDTPIPTPGGWTTMGALAVGDEVLDDRGHPCRVTHATEVMHGRRCYRVEFSDGTSIVADAEHRWATFTRKPENVWGVWTTEEIAATLTRGNDRNHSMPPAAVLSLPEADLPIEPYVLGVWLGDGNSRCARVTCGARDKDEMLAHVTACGEPARAEHEKGGVWTLLLNEGHRSSETRARSLQKRLRGLGLLANKHIPPAYLRASSRQRLALLQGLMDTDGSVSPHGQCEYVSTCPRLFAGFAELARSLGIKVTASEDRARVNGKDCGLRYRAKFYSYADRLPAFRLSRKLARLKRVGGRSPRGLTRKIVGVEPVESVPVRCIEVDSATHLYLAGEGMVATHNTELAAGVLLYLLLGTGKTDQRIYSASGDRAQASLIYHAASRMVRQDPTLDRLCLTYDGYKRIVHEPSGNVYEALSSEAYSKHGLGPSAVLFDEVHVLRDREFHDVLTTGFGARTEPLTWYITTAGWDRLSLCYQLWSHAEAVRDGLRQDPTFLPILYAASKEMDWRSEDTWRLAMPALGDFCSIEFIREEYQRALHEPSFENTFKQLYLNLWTEQAERWIGMDRWAACGTMPLVEDDFDGRECFGGLDLAQTGDMAAFSRVFQEPSGGFGVLCRFYAPEQGRWRDEPQNRELYRVWAQQGCLTLTPGEEIDFNRIEADVVAADERTPISLLLADRAFALQLCTRLMNTHGFGERVQFLPQTPIRLNEPTLELERLVNSGKFRHGGHPVLSWNAQNATVRRNATGLILLDKSRSSGRIDGLAATVNAIAAAISSAEADATSPLVLL